LSIKPVEQPRVRAQFGHVRGDSGQDGERAQAPEDAPDADRVADRLAQAEPGRDLEVDAGGRVHADLDRVDHEVGAVEGGPPVERRDHRRTHPVGVGDAARERGGGGEPRRIDVVQDDAGAGQLGEAEDVGQQLAGEDDAARAEENDGGQRNCPPGCDAGSVVVVPTGN
jgi:hypothetical protein